MDTNPIKICFTGHRPEKLGGYNWDTPKNQEIIQAMKKIIWSQIKDNLDSSIHFFFGGALGIDQMMFDTCLKLKEKKVCEVNLILCIPFEKQASMWQNKTDLSRYTMHKRMADEIVYVDEIAGYVFPGVDVGEYHPAKMQLRNQYMVDNSDIVITCFDGSQGGTANCLKYALKEQKTVIRLNPKDMSIIKHIRP